MANMILQTIESIPPTNSEAMSSIFPLLMLYQDTKNYSLYTRMHKIISTATSSGHSFSSNDYIDGRSGALKIVTELYKLTHEDIYYQAAKKLLKR